MGSSTWEPSSRSSTATVSVTVKEPDWMERIFPFILGGIMILWRMEGVS